MENSVHFGVLCWRVAAGASFGIWAYLFASRAGFWRLRERLGEPGSFGTTVISAVIPARDEAEVIGEAVRSLRKQTGAFRLHIVVADDESSDGTGNVAGADSVVRVVPRPAGWKGKLWALEQGLAAAPGGAEFILFTDADIAYASPDVVARLLTKAAEGFDLVTVMAHLRCESAAEHWLIPAFVYFFFKLYPPAWVARGKVAAAAGGCMLVRRTMLQKIGGIASYRDALIDDCALTRRVSESGGRIWLGLSGGDVYSTRGYETAGVIRKMIARSAFHQLGHSAWLLLGTIAALVITYIVPLSFLLTRDSWVAVPSLLAWLTGVVMFWPAVSAFKAPRWTLLALPAIAAFYLIATVESAVNYWRGRGGEWKGRIQDRL